MRAHITQRLKRFSAKRRAILEAHPLWAKQLTLGNVLLYTLVGGIIFTSPYWPITKARENQEWAYPVVFTTYILGLAVFAYTVVRDIRRYRQARRLMNQGPGAVRNMLAVLEHNDRRSAADWRAYQVMPHKKQIRMALLLLERLVQQNDTRWWTTTGLRNRRRYSTARVVHRVKSLDQQNFDRVLQQAGVTSKSMPSDTNEQTHIATRISRHIAEHTVIKALATLLPLNLTRLLGRPRKKST